MIDYVDKRVDDDVLQIVSSSDIHLLSIFSYETHKHAVYRWSGN